jgi:predicted transcriptional regulator
VRFATLGFEIQRLRRKNLCTAAKLTQKQLAALVGTQQSVISRIEDADYDGHSLTMRKRIAVALKKQLNDQVQQRGRLQGR